MMMLCRSTSLLAAFICLPAVTLAFSPSLGWLARPVISSSSSSSSTVLFADGDDESSSSEDEPSLLIGSDLDAELSKFKSKYPTSEADYLAAARKRAESKLDSTNSKSTAEEWEAVAKQKKAEGITIDDDWEKSLEEAGNADSQILIPVNLMAEEGEEGDDGEEPEQTLLLF